MTNIQECLSYLRDIDFDRETLQRAREELADVTQRATTPFVSLVDVERAATLAWNEAVEAAAVHIATAFLENDMQSTALEAAAIIRALKREAK